MTAIFSSPGAYDPCYCHSGKKYKFCHYPIDTAPAIDKRDLSQKFYIERWSKSADSFREQGCYSWIASHLTQYSPKFILDVGCGDGAGILAMKAACPSNPQIISCDDNFHCLQIAQDRIKACGIDVKLIQRLKQKDVGPNFHEMHVEVGRLNIPQNFADIVLVEADIIWDSEFVDFLASREKFDAITVWLIGTYDFKPQCKNLGRPMESGIYRLTVQNRVYRLADRLLRVGGILQVVDRGELPKGEFLKQDTIRSHEDQAQGTSLQIIDYQFKEYQEPAQGTGISTVKTVGLSGRDFDLKQLAMISIISIKR